MDLLLNLLIARPKGDQVRKKDNLLFEIGLVSDSEEKKAEQLLVWIVPEFLSDVVQGQVSVDWFVIR
jgi:hypothetical protein